VNAADQRLTWPRLSRLETQQDCVFFRLDGVLWTDATTVSYEVTFGLEN
jgi:hypothetical protein